MSSSRNLSVDEKLEALRKAWGYAEVSQAVQVASGWRIWLVKNYTGRPIDETNGPGLPGNPTATRKIEYASIDRDRALRTAYRLTFKGEKRR